MVKKETKKTKVKGSFYLGGISKKYEKKREQVRKSFLTKEEKEYEKPSLKGSLEKLKKEERKEKVESVKSKLSQLEGRAVKRLFGGKLLKKPKAKLPSTDPKRFITSGLGKQELVSEGKTGYFNEEYIKEKQNWLS